MRVSAKGRYGLRALFELALNYGQGPTFIKDIAQRQLISEPFLVQIFLSLKKGGIIKSIRGAYGGYLLARGPEKISLKEILDILEGSERVTPCLDSPGDCPLFNQCIIKDFWHKLEENQDSYTQGVTLAHLVKKKKMRDQELAPPVYNI